MPGLHRFSASSTTSSRRRAGATIAASRVGPSGSAGGRPRSIEAILSSPPAITRRRSQLLLALSRAKDLEVAERETGRRRGARDVAAVLRKHVLDVLPLEGIDDLLARAGQREVL